ncbi:MAG TPA: DUF4129 domain-containing protein [Chloroflexota bacterium]|nr:DUF4129 domain-containing protein [Chloroflexota bacterium]
MTAQGAGEHLFRAVTLTLLVVGFAVSPVALVQMLVPGWSGAVVVVLCGAAAIEAYVSYQVSHQPWFPSERRGLLRLGELLALFTVTQLYVDVLDGQAPFEAGFPHLDTRTLAFYLPVLAAWLAISDIMEHLAALDEPEGSRFHAIPPLRRLAVRYFVAGAVLFVVAGATQSSIAGALHLPNADTTPSGPIVNVFAYFVLGLMVLGHLRLVALKRRWQDRKVSVTGGLEGRWLRYSLLFLALTAVVAFLLPTNHTIGLLGPGKAAWNELWGLIRGPLIDLLKRFSVKPTRTTQLPTPPVPLHGPPPHPRPHPHHGATTGGFDWGTLLRTAVFWMLIAAVALYLIRSQWRRVARPRGMAPRFGRLGSVLTRLWDTLRQRLLGLAEALGDHLPSELGVRLQRPGLTHGRVQLFKPGPRTPREHLIHYYLSVLRRSRRVGIGRTASQTPREFAAVLSPHIGPAGEDMQALTDAFVEARYSQHTVGEEEIKRGRTHWQRVQAALRGFRR